MRHAAPLVTCVVIALGCAGAPTEAALVGDEPRASTGDEREASEDGEEVLLVGALQPSSAPTPPSRPPTPPSSLPEGRTAAAPLVPEPALAAGDLEHARAMAIALPPGPQPTLQALVDELLIRIRDRTAAITAARLAYDAAATSPALRALAAMRVADLCDALGAALVSLQVAMPADIEAQMASGTPELRDEVRSMVLERLREALAPQASAMFCNALRSYRDALADGSGAQRATAQLEAYGPAFAASCRAP